VGIYAGAHSQGRKGFRFADRGIDQIRLVINLSTAKALRVEVPPRLSARADKVIE